MKYVGYVFLLGVICGVFYYAGYQDGEHNQLKIQLRHENKLLSQIIDRTKQYQTLAMQYQNKAINDKILIESLINENANINDNLNHCMLTANRLQSIQRAAKNVPLSHSSSTFNGAHEREHTVDVFTPTMSCHDLFMSYLTCSSVYSKCSNRLSELQDWVKLYSK